MPRENLDMHDVYGAMYALELFEETQALGGVLSGGGQEAAKRSYALLHDAIGQYGVEKLIELLHVGKIAVSSEDEDFLRSFTVRHD